MDLQELLQELRVIFYLKDILWVLLGIIAIILIFDLDKKIEAKLMTKRRRKKMKINMKKEKALDLLQEISCMFHGSDPVLKTEYRDAIYVVLDLVEKQDKEIEKQKKLNDILLKDVYNSIQNDDNAQVLSIEKYNDDNTFEEIKDKYEKL